MGGPQILDHGSREYGPPGHGQKSDQGRKDHQVQARSAHKPFITLQQACHLSGFFQAVAEYQDQADNECQAQGLGSGQGHQDGLGDGDWMHAEDQTQRHRAAKKGVAQRPPAFDQHQDQAKNE